jgi:hypothetical protein
MHDLYLPVISVEAQNGFGCGRVQTGYQIGGFCFIFCHVAGPDMLAIAGDPGDAPDCGPCIAHVFAECAHGQKFNFALINTPVTGLRLFVPLREGKKPAL